MQWGIFKLNKIRRNTSLQTGFFFNLTSHLQHAKTLSITLLSDSKIDKTLLWAFKARIVYAFFLYADTV